ncbi:amino acid permease [Pseudomonas sp. SCB32]|uniref:amino acid permease n=1 Tax=Pseudomonas sp. SCB32 TaxID=2653853 RepID=UPI0012642AF9
MNDASTDLHRGLSNRHVQFIALGGAIGSGLFMGAGKTISTSGTSIVLTYFMIGMVLFFVMRAMGELLLSNLNYRTFADFCADYLGPWAGFFIGWSYWLTWIVAATADCVVIGGYIQYWFPELPAWAPAMSILIALLALNLVTVKVFGEIEFWCTLVKVVAVVALIVSGLILIGTSFTSPNGVQSSFAHLVDRDAFLPHGVAGFFAGFQIAIFSFAGIEMIGTTAAEAENPHKTLPKAINAVPIRVMIFYVLSLACIIGVCSWSQISPERSPFVQLFLLSGLPLAAGFINLVLTTSSISAANSGVFCTSRTLFGMASAQQAPGLFNGTTRSRVPGSSLLFSCLCISIGAGLLIFIPEVMTVFTLVSTVASTLLIFIWTLILVTYLVYRRQRPDLHLASSFKMPFGVPLSILCIGFFIFTLWLLTLQPDTRAALTLMPAWFGWLAFIYLFKYRVKVAPAEPAGA